MTMAIPLIVVYAHGTKFQSVPEKCVCVFLLCGLHGLLPFDLKLRRIVAVVTLTLVNAIHLTIFEDIELSRELSPERLLITN